MPGHQGDGVPVTAGMLPQARPVLCRPGEHPGDGGDDPLQGLTAARVSAALWGQGGGGKGMVQLG